MNSTMRLRDAARRARKFIADRYPSYEHWNFDICEEARTRAGTKAWSFGLAPDQEDVDYEPGRSLTGYVHADGAVEGLY